PGLGAPLCNLAALRALQGDGGENTLELAQRAIELDGPLPDRLDARALAYLAASQIRPAIADLEEAVAVSPTPDKLFHLARAYQAAARPSEAATVFQRALKGGFTPEFLLPVERPRFEQLRAPLEPRSPGVARSARRSPEG